jgi:hypothetical protein
MADFEENKLTFQQIVMRQVRIIQDISSKELRDSSKTIKNFMGEQTIESEDTRISYLQAVEMLGSLLSPYFLNKKISDNFDSFCEANDTELKEALKDEEFKLNAKTIFGNDFKKDKNLLEKVNIFLLNEKIKLARKMFRELIKLFKDQDFLANESYNEGSSSDEGLEAIDDEDDEEETSLAA